MSRRRIIGIAIAVVLLLLIVGYVSMVTINEERSIRNPSRIEKEIGYLFPEGITIVDTSASIFSLVDGKNYKWLIQSESSLIDWVNSIGKNEYDHTWRVVVDLNGRTETSYITIKNNGHLAEIETFRP